jgi:rhodanese-related sulfurtransferase
VRSQQAARLLEDAGFPQLYNLSGGIAAWSAQIEPTMPRY